MKVNELLKNRRSPSLYDPTHVISDEEILHITEAMRLAPSAFGLLTWRAVVVKRDQKLRDGLLPIFYDQINVRDASAIVLLVVSTYEKQVNQSIPEHIAKLTGNSPERSANYLQYLLQVYDRYKNDPTMSAWPLKEGYISLGTSLAAAEEIGIDTCPIEGMSKAKINEFLLENNLIEDGEQISIALLLGKYDRSNPRAVKGDKTRLEKDKFTKIYG